MPHFIAQIEHKWKPNFLAKFVGINDQTFLAWLTSGSTCNSFLLVILHKVQYPEHVANHGILHISQKTAVENHPWGINSDDNIVPKVSTKTLIICCSCKDQDHCVGLVDKLVKVKCGGLEVTGGGFVILRDGLSLLPLLACGFSMSLLCCAAAVAAAVTVTKLQWGR